MSVAEYEHHKEVEELRELVKGESQLYIGEDNQIIMRYLHFSNFNVKEAFSKMKAVYKHKLQNPKWYATSAFTEEQEMGLSQRIHCLLKDRDQLGRRIYIIKLGNIRIGELEPWINFQIDDLWLEPAMDETETQKNGLVFLVDMKNLSWRYMKYLSPHNCLEGSNKVEGMPLKHVEYHIVNSGLIINSLVTVVFPFLSGSTKRNIHFHKCDWSSLHKHITPDILPTEYGGKLPDLNYNELQTYLTDNKDRLEELVHYGYRKE